MEENNIGVISAEEPKEKKKFSFSDFKTFLKNNITLLIPYLGFILCIIVFSIIPPITTGSTIWTKVFFKAFVDRSITLIIISLGAMFIYSMGSMDISVGAMAGVASILLAEVTNATGSLVLGILVAISLTVVCGAINATIGELLHLPSVIGSIFLMFFAGGIQALVFQNKEAITLFGDYSFFGETTFKLIFVGGYLLLTFYLFKFTKLGKYTRAIGTNITVARQSGINVWFYKFLAYAYLGIAVVFASFNSLVRVGTVNKSTGGDFHMSIMIALILGGMPLSGGMKSKVSAAVVGTMIFNLLDTGLTLSGVPLELVPFCKAIILFSIIVMTCRKNSTLLQR